MQTTWAFISNYFVYSVMAVFTISFIAHAFETAFAVRAPEVADTTDGSLLVKTLDYKRTEKTARIATAMMILGFILLLAGVIARGISAKHVPWGNMYEFSITGALAFTGAYLAALRKYDLRWLGLLSSLYGRRRRIWVRITSSGVEVAGLAKNSAPGLEAEIQNFVRAIKGEK